MKMKRAVITACLTLMAFTMIAQGEPSVQSVDIVEYGIYRIELTGEHIQLQSTAAGAVEPASRAHLVTITNQLPALVGTTFGCHFVVKGEPVGAPVKLDIVVEHPPFKKPSGETSGTTDKIPWQYVIGQKVGYTYTFDNDWEAVPGEWSIQVWHDGKRLAEQKFIVKAKGKNSRTMGRTVPPKVGTSGVP